MRYAVISDIHANLEALRAVLEKISKLGADGIYSPGDIVGYNANPNECIDIVRSEKVRCVLGNHDACACGLREPDNFNPLARNAVLWTRKQLTESNTEFLRGLPGELQTADFFMCHGSIHDTDRYVLDKEDVRDNFRLLEGLPGRPSVCFFGHTHLKTTFSIYGSVMGVEAADEVLLYDDKRYLINPGSVGQPRDGDPRAAFLVYDTKDRKVNFYRTEYDIAACQDKIIKAGLPPRLAERLSLGW